MLDTPQVATYGGEPPWRSCRHGYDRLIVTTCIYCLLEKPGSAFSGREHVIPQAFGLFSVDNLVLKSVCDDCNGLFGNTIDRKLARDSAEGLDRIRAGLRDAKTFKSEGVRSTTHVELPGGAKGFHVRGPDGELGIMAFQQIGFSRSPDGPHEWFQLDALPTPDEMVAKGYDRNDIFMKMPELDLNDGLELLRQKGWTFKEVEPGPLDVTSGKVRAETVAKIGEPEMRAVTKICLNYVARVFGDEVALRPEFDPARNFVLFGKIKAKVRVYAYENPWKADREAHYLSVSQTEDMVVAQLSLLLRTQYVVVLAEHLPPDWLPGSAHQFDVAARKVNPMTPLPLAVGPPLKRIPD